MDALLIARNARLAREIQLFQTQPPWGITCRLYTPDCMDSVSVTLQGPKGSPYERGCFRISVDLPEKYPFEPPLLKFMTPIYHPNIDKGGRICMDMLKMPPKGGWVPTITLETLLVSLQNLLANPNPDDPLMLEIANEFKNSKDTFNKNAQAYTYQHAIPVKETCLNKARKTLQERNKEMSEKKAKLEAEGLKVNDMTLEEAQQEYEEFKRETQNEEEPDVESSQDNNENNT